MQVNLFGQSIEKPKILPSLPHGDNTESFEKLEKRVAKEYGRRHIGYPCDVAQDMQIDDRPEHIKGCPECQELIKKLDVIAYGTSNG
jgi:hypothetical protein